MHKWIRVLAKLQWVGVMGLAGVFFGIDAMKPLCFFWLFSLIDLFSFSRDVAGNLAFLGQNLGMLAGIPLIYLRWGFRLPDRDSYVPECRYSLPFTGSWLTVNGGVDRESSHSWGIPTQRYAYDFFRVDSQEKSYTGERTDLKSYYCYGQAVLAPADGEVVELCQDYDDTPIAEEGQADCTCPDVRGNYVLIRHGRREYSLLAHLRKGSVTVRPGDRVRRGDPIACCGNSGNTSEPHVHFHIQAGRSFLFSAGLPITFEGVEAVGTDLSSTRFLTRGEMVKNRGTV